MQAGELGVEVAEAGGDARDLRAALAQLLGFSRSPGTGAGR